MEFQTIAGSSVIKLAYHIYLPKNYEKSRDRWPMLMFLRGNEPATRGAGTEQWGPDLELTQDPKFGDAFPMLGVFPQLPEGRRWDEPEITAATIALIDELCLRLRIDPDRVYASGVADGGTNTWRLAMEAPDRFAAIVPAEAAAVEPGSAGQRLKGIAAWIAANDVAAEDGKKMQESMQKAQDEVQLTLLSDAAHANWQTFYADPQLYQWLIRHRRPR